MVVFGLKPHAQCLEGAIARTRAPDMQQGTRPDAAPIIVEIFSRHIAQSLLYTDPSIVRVTSY